MVMPSFKDSSGALTERSAQNMAACSRKKELLETSIALQSTVTTLYFVVMDYSTKIKLCKELYL